MKQQIEGDSKSGQAFLAILYIIIFFGIFGTVQMMISERRHEFGMMVAIGMKRGKLATIVTIEMLFLGFIGAAAGMLASVPVILLGYYYPFKLTGEMAEMYMDYGFDPIMPLAWFEEYFFTQGGVIFLMVILASYLPIRQILKLDLIKALHGN
jgi:ABC-type antimicrobial peptide transport system permease subunit